MQIHRSGEKLIMQLVCSHTDIAYKLVRIRAHSRTLHILIITLILLDKTLYHRYRSIALLYQFHITPIAY